MAMFTSKFNTILSHCTNLTSLKIRSLYPTLSSAPLCNPMQTHSPARIHRYVDNVLKTTISSFHGDHKPSLLVLISNLKTGIVREKLDQNHSDWYTQLHLCQQIASLKVTLSECTCLLEYVCVCMCYQGSAKMMGGNSASPETFECVYASILVSTILSELN